MFNLKRILLLAAGFVLITPLSNAFASGNLLNNSFTPDISAYKTQHLQGAALPSLFLRPQYEIAAVQWLPKFAEENSGGEFSKGNSTPGDDLSSKTCSDFKYNGATLHADKKNNFGNYCRVINPAAGLTCYYCICDASFKYNSEAAARSAAADGQKYNVANLNVCTDADTPGLTHWKVTGEKCASFDSELPSGAYHRMATAFQASSYKCEDGETRVVKDNPNGYTCYACIGHQCVNGYTTATTAANCSKGKYIITQDNNDTCKTCSGISCKSGEPVATASCPSGATCYDDTTCPDGQYQYLTDAQEYAAGNNLCRECRGAKCLSNYSTKKKSTDCKKGEILTAQSDNAQCKTCTTISCPANTSFDVPTCADGQILQLVDSSNAPGVKCYQCVNTPCDTGNRYSTATTSCQPDYRLETQTTNPLCKRCVSSQCPCYNKSFYSNTAVTAKCKI